MKYLTGTYSGSSSITVSTMWLVLEKKYTVWHFGHSRSPGNKFGRQFVRQ